MSSVGWKLIKRFSKAFMIEENETNFDFLPMNVRVKQLYQVYALYEGKQVRFHLQIGQDEQFHIMDPAVCPPPFRAYEKQFSDAIIASEI